jgi:hypothetical protein
MAQVPFLILKLMNPVNKTNFNEAVRTKSLFSEAELAIIIKYLWTLQLNSRVIACIMYQHPLFELSQQCPRTFPSE